MEMDNIRWELSCFWAKKKQDDIGFKWLPLTQHLLDTMNISGLLWNHWLSSGQKSYILESINSDNYEDGKKLVMFLGAIHDIGKMTPAFQTKKNRFSHSEDLDSQLLEKLEGNGFIDISNLSLLDANKSPHGLAGQAILKKMGLDDGVTSIIGGHHGKPVSCLEAVTNQIASYAANYYQTDSGLQAGKWKESQENLLKWVLGLVGYKHIQDIPQLCKESHLILNGLLIMADWIASNESYFPLLDIHEKGHSIDQIDRITFAWNNWRKTYLWEVASNRTIEDLYVERFGFKPRDIQEKIGEIIENCVNPGIFIVEAPMGIGKTEIALTAVEQLAEKSGSSGMFFGLPTQATSDGIFNRIDNWLKSIAKDESENMSIRLVHGKSALNEIFSKISTSRDFDGDLQGNVIVNQWFAGNKTAILDDFVVGTVDHFLLMSLKQKHIALRHLGLSKKIVVIDEVHAYDAYMGQYLYRAVNWMGAYRIPVVILSATLPASRRIELVNEYLRGKGKKIKDISKPDGWASEDYNQQSKVEAYPIITYTDGDSIKQFKNFPTDTDMIVEVETLEECCLINTIERSLSQGGIAGIIVNTVKRAQKIAAELRNRYGDSVELLHSSFISTDRVEKERKLLEIIGKGARRPFNKIIIGTQVIEQSLDIDFDVLFTDLAPMDLLIQRIGRLHRHVLLNRPNLLENPKVYVMGTTDTFDFDAGSSFVYGEYLLMRTQLFLPSEIRIPSDVSRLVQLVYSDSDEKLNLKEEDIARYNVAKEKMNVNIENKKSKASSFLLCKSSKIRREGSIIGILEGDIPIDSEEKGFAQVRDTQETIEVIVVKKFGEGYSFYGGNKDISMMINQWEISKRLATQTIKLPNGLTKSYNIDATIEELESYNLTNLSEWQNQAWLKGSLGIIFDEGDDFILNGFRLHYSKVNGLEYEKVVEDE